MDPTPGARTFQAAGDDYDRYMGRYSRRLAPVFAEMAGVSAGMSALDVGCGPGALTAVLAERLGTTAVCACDPSPRFVADCRARCPGVDVRDGRAEELPFEDDVFDVVLAQLVLHFVSEPDVAARELARVVRPGGTAAACVWDFDDGMKMLRHFWDAARTVDPNAPDEAATVRFGRAGEIAGLLAEAGFEDVTESTLTVRSEYEHFDELWSGYMLGIGPAGSYCVSLPEADRRAVRTALFERLGSPAGRIELSATARCARGRRPAPAGSGAAADR